MQIDGRTLLMSTSMMMAILSFVIFSMRRTAAASAKGLEHFAIGTFVGAVGTLLIGLRGEAPLWLSLIVGNAAVVASAAFEMLAVRRFDGKTAPLRWVVFAVGLVVVAQVSSMVFSFEGALQLRVLSSTLLLAGLMGATAWNLLTNEKMSISRAMALTSYVGFTTTCLVRVFFVLFYSTGKSSIFDGATSSVAMYFASAALGLCAAVGFILMVTDRVQAHLFFLASHDPLTGARTRRSFMDIAAHEIERSARSGKGAALLMADLDHFKSINDRFGHQAGDRALQNFVTAAKNTLRRDDVFARYGGEEFVALLPNTSLADAMMVADRLRTATQNQTLITEEGVQHITVSIGVADTGLIGLDVMALIGAADKALYHSKHTGRNKVFSAAKLPGDGP
jgi:diguanylate cyclase (GGDEF)-like protein